MEPGTENTIDTAGVTAVVICGGGGSRMGGVDKGLVMLAEQRLVEHVIQRIAPQVGHRVILNCNRNADVYQQLGYPCVADLPEHAGRGPLAGILAGLVQVRTPYCLICPCDTPLIPHNMVGKLLTALEAGNTDMAIVHDGVRLQPLHCLLRNGLAGSLRKFLEKGGHAVHSWLETVSRVQVDFSDQPAAFRNLNTREDLRDCASRWKDAGTCMQ